MKTKILCILDGFGIGPDSANNAITRAKMPNLRRVMSEYFWTTLDADGEAVGQEAGLVGNSEVGHMNIGGLQLVPQLSYQITKSGENGFEIIEEGGLKKGEFLQTYINPANQPDQIIDPSGFLIHNSKSKTIHLIGLFSTGTIHSDLRHWIGAIESSGKSGMDKIVLHLISDGRDSDKKSLLATWEYFTKTFEARLKPYENRIFLGSLGGRFYAMDRDNNMERTIQGLMPMFEFKIVDSQDQGLNKPFAKYFLDKYKVDVIKINKELQKKIEKNNNYFGVENTKNFYYSGEVCQQFIKEDSIKRQNGESQLEVEIKITIEGVCDDSYKQNIFDETILPVSFYYNDLLNRNTKPPYGIQKSDNLWLINFRSDRMKQLAKLICELNQEFDLNLNILAMNDYGIGEENKYTPIFRTQKVPNTLAQTISSQGQTQLHIAETEKYAHVTYFLNGGSQEKNQGEDWELIPSNKVNSHADIPEMKAKEITDYILAQGLGKYDYIIVNYANPDMVAHTGLIPESISSLEFLDMQLGRLIGEVETNGHSLVIIADHGNCEFVGEYTRQFFSFSQELNKQIEDINNLTDTEHNPNPVPCIIVDKRFKLKSQNITNRSIGVNKTFLTEIKIKTKAQNIIFNESQFTKVFEQNNNELIDQSDWPTQDQINKIKQDQLPLWYAGLILLNL
jgi:bisphosphoglycerate-independent phosphoglycerate mutase (AlkP superfamily)